MYTQKTFNMPFNIGTVVELPGFVMTSDNMSGGYSASASSFYGPAYAPHLPFRKVLGTSNVTWVSKTPSYIKGQYSTTSGFSTKVLQMDPSQPLSTIYGEWIHGMICTAD